MIKLRQEISNDPRDVIQDGIFSTRRNEVEIIDEEEEQIINYEEEDPDEHLFKWLLYKCVNLLYNQIS